MENSEIILEGSPFKGKEFLGSLAEYVIPRMKSHPKDNIAQIDSKTGENITIYDFLRKSIEITEGLIEFGLQKGDVVVVAADNSIVSHTISMGIMFSGGVFTPLNKNLKSREMEPLLAQFGPKFIICESEYAQFMQNSARAANLDTKIILLDRTQDFNDEFYDLSDITTKVDVENYTPRAVADPKKDLVYIACSSGSTGLPKGVALSHYSVVFSTSMIESSNLDNLFNSLLLTSPLFWISCAMLLIVTCVKGQTRYIPMSTKPKDILEGIQKFKPLFVFLSPASLLFMVEHPDFKNYDISSVKVVMTGGAILGKSIADKVQAVWRNITFFQGYGMTEVAGPITVPTPDGNILTVGKIGQEVKLKIVDINTGKSLGPNQVGECRVKTKTIMNGYYNNEKATKEAFDENEWYLTGDLGYYDENELLYIVGRIKEVIKYRNHQICPTEIESFLHGLPGIKDVAVVPVFHEIDGHHLKALVVKHFGADITEDYIIESVKENFSDFKHLRKGVQFVDSLPRSEIGKLKRADVIEMF